MQRWSVACACAVVMGCGGQAVVSGDGQDASPDWDAAVTMDAPDTFDANDEESDVATQDVIEASPDVQEPDAEPKPWDGTCACKNWTDKDYPSELYWYENIQNCVRDDPCPSGLVCCAASCVDPSFCKWHGYRSEQECADHPDVFKGYCCGSYTFCVAPERCAPEGVLKHGVPWDPTTVNLSMCEPE